MCHLDDLEGSYVDVNTINLHSNEFGSKTVEYTRERGLVPKKYQFCFPKSIKIIGRSSNGDRDNEFFEVVITRDFGRLVVTYFPENILIETGDIPGQNKRKLCKILKGTIIGDRKFISVNRKR